MIYFDYAASAPILPEVLESMMHSWQEDFINPSAPYKPAMELSAKISKISEELLRDLGYSAKSHHLLFTSSATESNNTICQGVKLKLGQQVLLSRADHASTSQLVPYFEKMGATVIEIPLLAGRIDLEKLKELDLSKVKLAILTHINGQSGIDYRPQEVATHLRQRSPDQSIHIHLDAVQALGRTSILDRESLFDSMTITTHKVGGPKGIALLVVKKVCDIQPLLWGGGQQEGLRSSTMVFPLIKGLFVAFKIANQRLQIHRERFRKFHQIIEERAIYYQVPFRGDDANNGIITIVTPNIFADVLMRVSESREIYLSTTSACSSKKKSMAGVANASEQLSKLGISPSLQQNVLRLSFGDSTVEQDIITVADLINSEMERLTQMGKRKT